MDSVIVEEIYRHLPKSGRRIIFVCGLPGSGKTTFCRRAAATQELAGPAFHTDWFLEESSAERRRRMAPEDPYLWYDWDEIRASLGSLRDT